jgi:hypothetical protein
VQTRVLIRRTQFAPTKSNTILNWEKSMSAYDLDTILKKWERAELSTEQAVGQILLLLQTISHRVGQLEVAQAKNRRQDNSSSQNN